MTALRGLIIAAALAGGIALAGAKPAAAQGLTNEELVIGGLLIAGGLLLAEELTNDDDHRDRWRDHRYRWRDERRFEPIPRNIPGGWIVPPAYRIVPPPPPGWYVVQNRTWPRDIRPGRGHVFNRGRGHDDGFRPGYGFGHRH